MKKPGKGARSSLKLRGKPRPLGPSNPTPLQEGPGKPEGGRRLGTPQSPGAPGLIRALRGGATPQPGEAPRPSTRFLPGAGPVGHKPSAVKFKEVRETLRRNLSSAGK